MQKWEYLFVSAVLQGDQWRVKYVNGKEFAVSNTSITLYEYANKMGDDGWELISAPYTAGAFTVPRLIFKRPKL